MSLMSKVSGKMRSVRPGVRNKLMVAWFAATPVAVLLSLIALFTVGTISVPPQPDVQKSISDTQRVRDWTEDYMTLWLAGSGGKKGESSAQKSLESMTSVPGGVTLPPTGYTVRSLDVSVNSVASDATGSLWSMRTSAVVVSPGSSGLSRIAFDLNVAEHGGGYRVYALPRPVNTSSSEFGVSTAYTEKADPAGALGQAAQNFVSAYMTPDNSTSSLGSTVTSDFPGSPLATSLWSDAEVTDINWYGPDPQFTLAEAAQGDTVNVLLTVRASTSTTTYSTVQLPVTMTLTSNDQWAVASIDESLGASEFTSGD